MVHLDYVPEMIGSASANVDVIGLLDSPLWMTMNGCTDCALTLTLTLTLTLSLTLTITLTITLTLALTLTLTLTLTLFTDH